MEKELKCATDYSPERLLDDLKARFSLNSDSKLAKKLSVSPAVISRIRHRQSTISGTLLIRIHELTNATVSEVRNLMGDRRRQLRVSTSARYKSAQLFHLRAKSS